MRDVRAPETLLFFCAQHLCVCTLSENPVHFGHSFRLYMNAAHAFSTYLQDLFHCATHAVAGR
jgi:hypothetical protein